MSKSRKERRAAERNRANAQFSTGPKTAEGKTVSSQNNFRHGLYSTQLVLPGENAAELDALKADLRSEHQPVNTTEDILVNEMAEHYWRIKRARLFETKILSTELDVAALNAAHRLMSSAERGFHKALKALREMQKTRGFESQIEARSARAASTFESQIQQIPQNQRPIGAEAARAVSTAAIGSGNTTGGFESQNGTDVCTEEEPCSNSTSHPTSRQRAA